MVGLFSDKCPAPEKGKPKVISGRKASAHINSWVERLPKGSETMLLPLKQFLLWCLGGSAIVVPTSLMTAYYAGGQDYNFNLSDSPVKPVELVRFDSLDAARVCEIEAKEKFEGRLLHSSVNWHSTRFQESRNVYVVMLDGNVGEYTQQESVNIYCYVNPKSEQVSYFKAYDSDNKPMLSNAIHMDAMLKSFGSGDD